MKQVCVQLLCTLTTQQYPHSPATAAAIVSISPARQAHSCKPAAVVCGSWMEQTDRETDGWTTESYIDRALAPPWRFAPCRLDIDTLLCSIATLPQSLLPSCLIRGYHLQTLLTLPWLPYTSCLSPLFLHLPPFLSFPAPTFLPPSPLIYMPIICPYSCYIRLLLHYFQLYGL